MKAIRPGVSFKEKVRVGLEHWTAVGKTQVWKSLLWAAKNAEPIRQEGQGRRYLEGARGGENLRPSTERRQQREHRATEVQFGVGRA